MKIPFRKYLDREDLAELKKRQDHINQHLLIVESLTMIKNMWINQKFSKYGVDSTKNYSINSQTGQIKEIKKDGLPKDKKNA